MSIHLSDRCQLLDSSQLWKQLETHFLTSCQSLKCSSVFCEKEHRQPHMEENFSWGSPGDCECLREQCFRSRCSLNYFHSHGYALVRYNNLRFLILCNSFHEKMHSQFSSGVFLITVGNQRRKRGLLNLAAPEPISVSQLVSLSVNEIYSTL